jgi:DNA repair protein RecN (Recombination protein N)
MLKELSLHNFVIAKACSISFGPGFNVLSGETGTGKTMLIQALSLLLGQKADVSLIRKGEEKAVLKAVFEINNPKIYNSLQENGIDIQFGEDLLILREINISGKNRILINNQQIALPLLKSLGSSLVETISQHSQLCLKENSVQRELLDEFGGLSEDVERYKIAYLKEHELEVDLKEKKEKHSLAEKQTPFWKASLEELSQINVEENEEESLFQEYKKLTHLQDLLKSGSLLFSQLSEDPSSILEMLSKLQKEFGKLITFDPGLESIQTILESSHELLSEASFQLGRYLNTLESEPERFQEIEARLTALKLLKKKYGISLQEITSYKLSLMEHLEEFHQLEKHLYLLSEEVKLTKVQREEIGKCLSHKREESAKHLSKALTTHLQELNMKNAIFKICIETAPPTPSGCDLISFYLAANLGEDFYKIKDHASGGELSRILFALKLLLADKEKEKALIFDEIDANIGGVTASILGKQLKSLGQSRQVICITHFPQVAAFADHHMQMIKTPSDGRIVTEVKTLSEKEKQEELLRMLGGTTELFQYDNKSKN